MIDHLQDLVDSSGQPPHTIASFYFDYNDLEAQEPHNFVKSLLRQILSAYNQPPAQAKPIYEDFLRNKRPPSFKALCKIFLNVCRECKNATILLDGLDECDARQNRRTILKVLKDVMDLPDVKMFATCRPSADDARSTFSECSITIIRANDSDIRSFVIERIEEAREESEEMQTLIDEQLGETITTSVVEKADGMYVTGVTDQAYWILC